MVLRCLGQPKVPILAQAPVGDRCVAQKITYKSVFKAFFASGSQLILWFADELGSRHKYGHKDRSGAFPGSQCADVSCSVIVSKATHARAHGMNVRKPCESAG